MQAEERIARLERRCRILSVGLTAAVCAGGLLVLAGAAQRADDDSTLRTRRIEIIDSEGNARIVIGRVEDDVYGVLVYGPERQIAGKLMAGSQNGGEVVIISAGKGRHGVRIIAQEETAGVAIRDKQALRAAMLVHEDKAQLQLRGRKNNLVFVAPIGEEPIGERN